MNVIKRNEEDNNYYKTELPQDELEWKGVIGRKIKGGVVKIIGTIGKAVESTSEQKE